MSNYTPPPAPPGYGAPQPPQNYGAPQPQYGAPPQAPAQTGWVDNRQVIGGWAAQQYGMQTGKHIEYKVMQQPTAKGGIFKSVKFFKPFQKKNQTWGESDSYNFNQMKELVERINHFQNTYCEEKGYFVWQPAGPTYGVGNPPASNYGAPPPQAPTGYPPPAQPAPGGYGAPTGYAPPASPPPGSYGAPAPSQYPPPQAANPAPVAPQPAPGYTPPTTGW